LEYGLQREIGGVSPKLLYRDDSVQYAGMVTGVRDFVGTAFHTWDRYDSHYHSLVSAVRNVSVLTGACLLIRKEVFWEVGGWNVKDTPIANSDLDLSFKLLDRGYRLIYTPYAELRHVGHVSIGKLGKGPRVHDSSHLYMLARWGDYLSYDPYFPPNMRELIYHQADGYMISARQDAQNAKNLESGKRVLVVTHDLSLSGAPIVLLELACYLKREGYFLVVASALDGALRESFEEAGIPIIVEPRLDNSENAVRLFSAFDIIVPSTVVLWPAIHIAASRGKPCLWLVHESEFGVEHISNCVKEAKKAFGTADVVVFPAKRARQLYDKWSGGSEHGVVYYGLSDPRLEVDSTHNSSEVRDDKVRLVSVGSVERRKGFDVLIKALLGLDARTRERLEAFFVGRLLIPEYVSEVQELARELPNVRFIGEVDRNAALKYIDQCDLFVCTSRQETGPIVVFEAMALEKPVITTRVGAAGELIQDGNNGFLIDVDDVAGLQKLITELAQHPERRKEVGRRARQFYEQSLSIERYGSEIRQIIDRLISERQA
jgi:glycosyltransferase involved in cell wall biosynthesis